MAENETPQAAENEQAQSQFSIQKVFVKDSSFESPNSPAVFQKAWNPEVQMDLNTKSGKIADDHFEVILSITLTTKVEDLTAYIVEVQQAAVFMIKGLEGPQLAQTLNAFCPNVLFPYARETIDNLLVKGGFPPIQLAPVNFDAMFAQAVMQQQQQAQAEASDETSH